MHIQWLRELVIQGCEMCGRVWKPDLPQYVFVVYCLWIELGILHPDVNGEALTLRDLRSSCYWESWQRSRNVNEHMDTGFVIQHDKEFQLRYSSGTTHWSLLWYCLFDIIIKSLLASSVVNLMPVHTSVYKHVHITLMRNYQKNY